MSYDNKNIVAIPNSIKADKVSKNAVINVPEPIAGSSFNLCIIIGITLPIKHEIACKTITVIANMIDNPKSLFQK